MFFISYYDIQPENIVEADSIESAMRWAMKWNDLMDISLDPAVEDEVVGQMCIEKLTALGEI